MTCSVVTVTIIGAGVIGLAVAEELSARVDNVLVVEKNRTYGQETSSRHSGVIHAGIYYPAGFLKARLCREGNRLLYDACSKRDIPHRKLGKLIVAGTQEEEETLAALCDQARQNGVDDLVFLSKKEIRALEPEVRASSGLYSPSTGILDSHGLMRSFYINAESNGAIVSFNAEVTRVRPDGNFYELEINHGEYRFRSRMVINCAGLHADRIAAMPGIDIDREGYRLTYCKGNYFSISPALKLNHLVYPVPQAEIEGLGIHTTVDLGGRVRFGPDTEYVDELEYTVDEGRKDSFYRSVRTYLPAVKKEHLHPEMCGIRPKLQGPGDPSRDFIVQEDGDLGYPGLINLIGIESPGLTSCIPMARHVLAMVESWL